MTSRTQLLLKLIRVRLFKLGPQDNRLPLESWRLRTDSGLQMNKTTEYTEYTERKLAGQRISVWSVYSVVSPFLIPFLCFLLFTRRVVPFRVFGVFRG